MHVMPAATNDIIKFGIVSFGSLSLSEGNGFSVPAKRQGIGGSGGCPDRIILF